MDIHRCRFVPYQPQSINALAFSHSSNPKQKTPQDLRLALGRANGDVEIWNPIAGRWYQEKVLRGSRDRTVEQLVWTQELLVDDDSDNSVQNDALRLFSSSGSPSVTEWDLTTGQQKRQAEAASADIWCLAVQPQWKRDGKDFKMSDVAAAPSQLLAAGCEDGSINLFTTADDDLQFLRTLAARPAKRTKVLSLAWRGRNTIIAGYEDSMIRVVDVSKRTILRTMSLGKPNDDGPSVVWTLKCLPDGTILSGDSSGELKIWDSRNFSLLQRLQTHEADILDITASFNGDAVFTVGVDRRLVAYRQLPVQASKARNRWQEVAHRRFHQHDVKALVSFESKELSVMVSGGIDTVPIVLPLRNWETENHRTLTHLPQKPQMSFSSHARLMLTWWERDLLIWHLPKRAILDDRDFTMTEEGSHQLLARLQLKGDEHITSAQISEDGRLIVAATAAGVKLFQVRKRVELGKVDIRTRPIELPTAIRSFGAYAVGFSPNTEWLYAVRLSSVIAIAKLTAGESSKDRPHIHPQVSKLSCRERENSGVRSSDLKDYHRTISCVAFSADSRTLAAGDLSGAVDVWMLQGHEDLRDTDMISKEASDDSDSDSDSNDEQDSRVVHGQKWTRSSPNSSLPHFDSGILALTFKPQSRSSIGSSDAPRNVNSTHTNPPTIASELSDSASKLIVITASHQILEFNVLSGKFSAWSRRNPSSYLPQSFTQIKDRAMGVFWDNDLSSGRERLWLYGPTWLFMLDMTRDLPIVDSLDKIGQIGNYDVREPPSSTASKRAIDSSPQQLRKKRKRNTGAGDERVLDESGTTSVMPPSKSNKLKDSQTGLASPISSDAMSDNSSSSDIETESFNALAHLRRGKNGTHEGEGGEKQSMNRPSDHESDTDTDIDADNKIPSSSSPHHHIIFRYRSIFGIATIQKRQNKTTAEDDQTHETTIYQNQNQNQTLEIILVERPLYDVDLAPRFSTGQDWST